MVGAVPNSFAYVATLGRARLRIHAIRPAADALPDGAYRVSVQAYDAQGRPIADDPIHRETMTQAELTAAMDLSREQGWTVEPCPATAHILKEMRSHRIREGRAKRMGMAA